MVDWERVERLRSKGVDWDEIAADEKVHYTAPEGVDDAGRALKTLYYSKKSRGQSRKAKEEEKASTKEKLMKSLIPVGLLIAIAAAIWFLFANYTSLVGFFLPAYPDVLLVVIAGVVILAIGLVLGTARISEVWKKPVAGGIVLGLVLSGSLALAATGLGVPNLTAPYQESGVGHGWEGTHNTVWTSSSLPVMFFYGSLACPYCGASSWALYKALSDFGTWSGSPTSGSSACSSSSSSDVYPNTPEVNFDALTYTSSTITLDAKEGQDSQAISEPGLDTYEQAYVNYYNSGGGIPFYVVGGIYIEPGAIVDPSVFHNSTYSTPTYTCSQIINLLANPSSDQTTYNAIVTEGAYYLEAFLYEVVLKANLAAPQAVTSNSAVMDIAASIS
jgi:hypothetical protein